MLKISASLRDNVKENERRGGVKSCGCVTENTGRPKNLRLGDQRGEALCLK